MLFRFRFNPAADGGPCGLGMNPPFGFPPPIEFIRWSWTFPPGTTTPLEEEEESGTERRGIATIPSSEADEASELHDPSWDVSSRTGEAFRRIVSSINCFA